MKTLLFISIFFMTTTTPLFDFSKESSLRYWYVVNDGVMGGVSSSNLTVNDEGHGVFKGTVRLENNGGFASIRHNFEAIKVTTASKICLKIKGDGNKYQVRVKQNDREYYSYIQFMETSGEWQTITIPLKDFYPSFRGRTLDLPNFKHNEISEFAILIGNKKKQDFELLIDLITLE